MTIASIAAAIAAGLGNARTSTLRFARATFLRARVLDRCGHESAGIAPASIADWTEGAGDDAEPVGRVRGHRGTVELEAEAPVDVSDPFAIEFAEGQAVLGHQSR